MLRKYKWLITLLSLVGCRQDTPPAPTYPKTEESAASGVSGIQAGQQPGPLDGDAEPKDNNSCLGTDCVAVSVALQKQCKDFGFSASDCNRSKWPQDFYDKVVVKAKEISLGSCANRIVEVTQGGLNLRETANLTSQVIVVLDNKTPLTVVEAPSGDFIKVTTDFNSKTYTGYVALKLAPCSSSAEKSDTPVLSYLNCTIQSPANSDGVVLSVSCYAGQKVVKNFTMGTKTQASSGLYTFAKKPGINFRQINVDKAICYMPEQYVFCNN